MRDVGSDTRRDPRPVDRGKTGSAGEMTTPTGLGTANLLQLGNNGPAAAASGRAPPGTKCGPALTGGSSRECTGVRVGKTAPLNRRGGAAEKQTPFKDPRLCASAAAGHARHFGERRRRLGTERRRQSRGFGAATVLQRGGQAPGRRRPSTLRACRSPSQSWSISPRVL